jgi:hypothetical protein
LTNALWRSRTVASCRRRRRRRVRVRKRNLGLVPMLKFMPIQSIMVDSEAKTNEAASSATSGVETLSEICDNHTFSFSLNADPGRPQRLKNTILIIL